MEFTFGPHWKSLRFAILLMLFVASVNESKGPHSVIVGKDAVMSFNKTCNGTLKVTLKKNEEVEQEVLRCDQGTCTEGDGFKNRARFVAGSLVLSPSMYNDKGWYNALCDSKPLGHVHLTVVNPTDINAMPGSNITLPCYAITSKQIPDKDVIIKWKKDDHLVLAVENEITTFGAGYEGRASVELAHFRNGDLSLRLLQVNTSDKGLYLCYHAKDEVLGDYGAIKLDVEAHRANWSKKSGDNVSLDLFDFDNVTVTFTGTSALKEVIVCHGTRDKMSCPGAYTNRFSVTNNKLVLSGLTSDDMGDFTVKNTMNEVISINTVTVDECGTQPSLPLVITLVVLFVFFFHFLLLFLCFWKYQKSQEQNRRLLPYGANPLITTVGSPQQESNFESGVCLIPLEEKIPASRSPQQENNSEALRASVEESKPDEQQCLKENKLKEEW